MGTSAVTTTTQSFTSNIYAYVSNDLSLYNYFSEVLYANACKYTIYFIRN